MGYQSGESATDINLRGQGIFSKIMNFALDIAIQKNIDFFFGFPDSMSYGPALRFGYYPVATYYFYIRPLNPFKKIRYKENCNKYNNYPSMMLIEHDKITPIVNDEYWKWRYENNPKHYDIIEYVEDNSRAVFYLRKKMWKYLSEMILLDCQFSNYNEIFLEHAFKYLFLLYARKAFYIRTFFNKNTERGRFLNSYFPIRVKSRNCKFMVKNISGRIDSKEILNLNQWEIMPHCVDDL